MRTLVRSVGRSDIGGEPLPSVFKSFESNKIILRRAEVSMLAGTPGVGKSTVFDADVISGTHIVFLNGLMQTIGSDYTATNASNGGITVTFNNAPASTDTLRIYGVPAGTEFNGIAAVGGGQVIDGGGKGGQLPGPGDGWDGYGKG